jgi:hypothetical protein
MKTSHIASLQTAADKIGHDDKGNAIYTIGDLTVTTNYDVKTKTFTATFDDGSVSSTSAEGLNLAIDTYLKAQNRVLGKTDTNNIADSGKVIEFTV